MKHYSITTFANFLGVSRQAILQNLNSGKIAGTRAGSLWIIPERETKKWETRTVGKRKFIFKKRQDKTDTQLKKGE